MNRATVVAGFAGAVLLFAYSAVAWMVLPWNEASVKGFPDEASVVQALSQIKEEGIYLLPGPQAMESGTPPTANLSVFAAVRPAQPKAMGPAMVNGFLIDLISALTAAWLLAQTSGLGYMRRVCFVAALGFLAAFFVQVSAWNWFGYSDVYTLVQVLDTTLAFALAGLGMAKLVKTA